MQTICSMLPHHCHIDQLCSCSYASRITAISISCAAFLAVTVVNGCVTTLPRCRPPSDTFSLVGVLCRLHAARNRQTEVLQVQLHQFRYPSPECHAEFPPSIQQPNRKSYYHDECRLQLTLPQCCNLHMQTHRFRELLNRNVSTFVNTYQMSRDTIIHLLYKMFLSGRQLLWRVGISRNGVTSMPSPIAVCSWMRKFGIAASRWSDAASAIGPKGQCRAALHFIHAVSYTLGWPPRIPSKTSESLDGMVIAAGTLALLTYSSRWKPCISSGGSPALPTTIASETS